MKKNAFDPVRVRIWALTGLMGLCLVAFAGVMYHTQILHGEENRAKSLASNAASETVEASRGIITDRNGKVLVSNRLTYTLIFSAKEFDTDQELNAAILRLTDLCTENGTAWNDTLPVSRTAPYSYMDPADGEGFALFLKNKDIPYSTLSQVTPTLQPDRFMAKLRQLFNIDDSYTEDQARTIAGVRYELSIKSLTDAQYVFADDVSVELISQTADGQYRGVSTGTSSARVYNTEYAAHVLGRLSPIYYEDWVGDPKNGITGYRDMEGYSMNSLVGREGAEKAFESYLHGTKGTRIITTNQEGKITGELYTKEPQPGGTVALTLDIDLQEDTEKSLAQTIQAMTQKDGVVRGGAAVVVGVGSGEVLAMASYPTYNLSTFDQDYSKLVSDTAGTPLLNRAIGGAYAPGSTFKPCTAVAALESGIITPSSTIVDRGYVLREKKTLMPTELGFVVTRLMKENFADIVDVAFTAGMEEKLDQVEEGKAQWQKVIADFYGPFEKTLEKAESTIEKVKLEDPVSDVPCDLCGAMMVIKDGRFGKFLACPNFPKCRCTKAILEKLDVPCPKCGGELIKRRTKKGKVFYGCSHYPECDFVSWDKPVNKKCPKCGKLLVQRMGRNGPFIACPDRECGYILRSGKKSEEKTADTAEE